MSALPRPRPEHGAKLGLPTLAQEIVGDISGYMSLKDLASVSMTCKILKAKFEPYLYETVDLNLSKTPDAHLLSLLVSRRPTVASYIRTLNIPDMAKNNRSHATGELVRRGESNKIHPAAALLYELLNPESFHHSFKESSHFGRPALTISLHTLRVNSKHPRTMHLRCPLCEGTREPNLSVTRNLFLDLNYVQNVIKLKRKRGKKGEIRPIPYCLGQLQWAWFFIYIFYAATPTQTA
jgi:hypothetical protein